MSRQRRGFTLIELLIVLVVIGVLAAIAIPNLVNALQRGKQKRTMEDMRTVGTACEAYAVDHDDYVALASAGPLSSVSAFLEPTYVALVPDRDGWGGDFVYEAELRAYTLTSRGRDKAPGGGGVVASDGTTTDFRDDIVFSVGAFLQRPDGTQR